MRPAASRADRPARTMPHIAEFTPRGSPPGMAPPTQHTSTRRARQVTAEQQTLDLGRVGIYDQHRVPSKHQVTALLLAKAWEGRRAFQEHGHALVANNRGNPNQYGHAHVVVLDGADLPTRDQARCRSTSLMARWNRARSWVRRKLGRGKTTT